MTGFTNEFWLSILIYIVTGISAVVTVAFKVGTLKGEFATKEELKDKVRERNEKIDRVYERLDEVKEAGHREFVRKDICSQLHIASKEEMRKMDEDYKSFRHEIRNTVQQIFDKIDELRALIVERK